MPMLKGPRSTRPIRAASSFAELDMDVGTDAPSLALAETVRNRPSPGRYTPETHQQAVAATSSYTLRNPHISNRVRRPVGTRSVGEGRMWTYLGPMAILGATVGITLSPWGLVGGAISFGVMMLVVVTLLGPSYTSESKLR